MTTSEQLLDEQSAAFLQQAGWASAKAEKLAGDASTRSYLRLDLKGRPAVLMIAPPGAESAACPPEAAPEERRALGYNAAARLAGPNLNAFIAIAEALRATGLSAPEIYAADASIGLALIEDLGDDLFARVIGQADEQELYAGAIDVLVALRNAPPQRPQTRDYAMMEYDATALMAETELLSEWYWPLKKGATIPTAAENEFAAIFSELINEISPPHSLVLRDYHAENLLWLPNRQGVQRVGLIDFQDGLYGAAAYDAVSLLEDARRDVHPDLAAKMIVRYCEGAAAVGEFDKEAFLKDYAILAAQRNAKILGIFARLAKRDGKPRYLDLLPRVEAHFARDLQRPGLERLHSFFAEHLPELAS